MSIIANAQITIVDLSDPIISNTTPPSPSQDMLWLDTSKTPNVLKRWNGSSWVVVNDTKDLENKVSVLQTDFKTEQGKISSLIKETTTIKETYTTKDEFNSLQIGGRNFARNTSSEWSEWLVPKKDNLNFCGSICTIYTGQKKVGDIYTVSFDIDVKKFTQGSGGTFAIQIQGATDDKWLVGNPFTNYNFTKKALASDYTEHVSYKVIIHKEDTANATKFEFGYRCDYSDGTGKFRIKNIKVEKGNKATDWTPAPEDLEQKVTTLTDSYNQTVQTVKGNTTTISDIKTSVNEVSGKITSMDARVTKVEQTADGVKTTVTANKDKWDKASSNASNAVSIAGTANSNASNALNKANNLEKRANNGEFNGRGVKSTEVEYKASDSGTTAPTGAWSTTIPTVGNGSYLWTRTTITYTSGEPSVGYSVARMGVNGTKGDKGETGQAGANGTSVTVKSTAVSYGISSNASMKPTSFSPIMPTVAQGQYLWTKTVVTYSDGKSTETFTYALQGVNGAKGDKGANGKDGVSPTVASTKVEYQQSTNGTTAPTGVWSTSVPTANAGQYMWTRTTVTYSDEKTAVSYSVSKNGSNGIKGDKGEKGEAGVKGDTGNDGKGIFNIVHHYLVTNKTTGVDSNTAGWKDSPQSVTATNKYLWYYQTINYTTGSPTNTTPAIIGVYGDTGGKGAAGKGITSVTPQYYLSNSNTTQTGGAWKTSQDAWSSGKYYWTRDSILWSDGTTTTTTPMLATALNNANSVANNAQTIANQTADKFTWIVKSGTNSTNFTLTDRTAQLVSDEINLKGLVTFKGLDSATQNKITDANNKINNLQIGGRNLLKNTGFENVKESKEVYIDNTYTKFGNNTLKLISDNPSSATSRKYTAIDFVEPTWNLQDVLGQNITISMWLYIEAIDQVDGYEFRIVYTHNGQTQWNKPNMSYPVHIPDASKLKIGWNYIYATYTIAEDSTQAHFNITCSSSPGKKSVFWISSPKAEFGNKATGWTPAPEDKANQSIIDNWSKDDIVDGETVINGGYIKTNTIKTNQLAVGDIFSTGNAVMNIINSQEINANRITSGKITSKSIDAYGLSILDKDRNIETFSIASDGQVMLRGSVESYDYISGKTGWSINYKGSAEFNDVTVRGGLITGDGGIASSGGLGVNLQKNTSFYNGLNDWAVSSNVWSVDKSVQYNGINSLRYSANNLSAETISSCTTQAKSISAKSGDTFTAQATFYTDNLSGITGTKPKFKIIFYNTAGTVLHEEEVTVSFINKQWVLTKITATAPANTVYVGISFVGYLNGTFYISQPKIEEGNSATEWSLSPNDKGQVPRFWAGTTYENREYAPFIVYNDGSLKAAKGTFGGVFTGDIKIGNVSITDPNVSNGDDATITVINGNTGVKAVQLTDMSQSSFAQDISITDNFYNEQVRINKNGVVNALNQFVVGNIDGTGNERSILTKSYLQFKGGSIVSSDKRLTVERADSFDVGSISNNTDLTVYGVGEFKKVLKITKELNFNDTVKCIVSDRGIDFNFYDNSQTRKKE